jgi:hypothetical protein
VRFRKGQQKLILKQRHGFYLLGRKRQRQEQHVQLPRLKSVDQGLAEILSYKKLEFRISMANLFQKPRQQIRRDRGDNAQSHFSMKRLSCSRTNRNHVFDTDQQLPCSIDRLVPYGSQNHFAVISLHQAHTQCFLQFKNAGTQSALAHMRGSRSLTKMLVVGDRAQVAKLF